MTNSAPSATAVAHPGHAQLRQILEHTSAAVFVKDLDGRMLFANREFERMKGLPLDAIVGRLDAELFPDATPDIRRNDRRIIEERRAIDFEESVETSRGRRIYLSHKFPLLDALGRAYAVCGIATDITDRKRIEDALRSAALAVSTAQGDDVFDELTRALALILGVDAAFIAVHPDGDPARLRAAAARLDGNAVAEPEFVVEAWPWTASEPREFRLVRGEARAELSRGPFAGHGMDSYAVLPLDDASGVPLGVVGVLHRRALDNAELAESMLKIFGAKATAEIERLRTTAALRDSELSYRAIFEASEDPIFVHDWSTGAILDVSPKAAAVYGYTPMELRHLRVSDISSNEPPYTDAEAREWLRKAKSGSAVRFEWRARHRDGHLMWHEVRLKPATIAGKPRILAFIRDITASRDAEDALRASEEQYRAIFNASADALVLWNSRLQRVDVNPAFERMYGVAREDVLRSTYPRDLPAEGVKRRLEIVQRTLAGESCHEEIESVRKNGEKVHVEVRTIRIQHRGEPHVLAMIRDVTDRRRAEHAIRESEQRLRASENRYRLLFEMESDAIVVTDARTLEILDANRAAERLWGYARDELMRLKATDLSAEEEQTRIVHQDPQASGTVPLRWHRKKDGTVFPVEISISHFTLEDREVALSTIRDITERRERENALARSEARLRATIEASFDCVIGMDSKGHLIEFNPAAERAFGFRRDEVLGKPLADLLIPASMRRAHEDGLARFRDTRQGPYIGRRIETTALRADGSEFPVELTIGVVRAGVDDLFIGYLRDIGERKAAERRRADLEAQLRQAQKMEAIGHLTGGIAHDFNNLLTTIVGYVTLAAERSSGDDAKLASYLDQATVACGRARELIQQMLTFSRGRRGQPRPVALASLVRDAIKLLRSSLPTTISLTTDLDEEAPAVLLDPVQLDQVLMNLAINARDAIRSTGEIRIAVRHAGRMSTVCTSCRNDVRGDMVELRIVDDGPGIAPEVRDRMFEPFFTTKEVGQGSGMGLATVHGIVHEHGGHVLVDSTPGAGATFRVVLPALQAAAATEPRVAAGSTFPHASLAGRVAVVDDEASVASFMRDLLGHWNLRTVAFADGRSALEAIAAGEAFDAVITDQTMPRMTGMELARAVRVLRPDLPILLYSGYAEQLTPEEAADAGVSALIRKPVDPGSLLEVLSRYMAPIRSSP